MEITFVTWQPLAAVCDEGHDPDIYIDPGDDVLALIPAEPAKEIEDEEAHDRIEQNEVNWWTNGRTAEPGQHKDNESANPINNYEP